MRFLKLGVLGLMVLGLAVALLADPVDPKVLFNQGGSHSTDINGSACAAPHPSCIAPINDAIVNGGGTFDIHNKSGRNITELIFFIPTVNFDQVFFAESNLFLSAFIIPDISGNLTDVAFFGTGSGPDATATIQPPLDSCTLCAPGFEDGQNGVTPNFDFRVEAFFGRSSGGNHPGLVNGDEGVLGLVPQVPEPGTFVLLVSAIALVAGGRKLQSRRTKI